jgi:endonuclease G
LRSLSQEAEVLHIFTGPLYCARKKNSKSYVKYQVIGKNEVAVPTHFFTLIFLEKEPFHFQVQGYILPNQAVSSDIPLQKFKATLEEIERVSGIVFSKIAEKSLRTL